ncbi:MAG TPA: hypothetical protein VI386_31665 [Candidatus Sulfotelmatobacter sp.]
MENTRQTTAFIGTMALTAIACSSYAGINSHAMHPYHALAILALAAATSRMKVKLPALDGNMSVNLPFLLAAVMNLSTVEAALITSLSTVVQCWPKRGVKLNTEQMVFNVSTLTLASSVAASCFHTGGLGSSGGSLAIASAAGILFLGQTIPVAAIITISQNLKNGMAPTWWNLARTSFPYFALSAGMTSMMQTVDNRLGWGAALAIFPVMFGIHHSYREYFAPAVEQVRTAPLTRAARAGA